MVEIRESLEKLRAASRLITKHEDLDLSDKSNIRSLRDTLFEINESVEQLKSNVNELQYSPIRYNK